MSGVRVCRIPETTMRDTFQRFVVDAAGTTSIEYGLLIASMGLCILFCASQVASAFEAAMIPLFGREL